MSSEDVPIRAAGSGTLPDGSLVMWVVSEGRRGRRWRETVTAADGSGARRGGIRSSLLLETDPQGRFLHLELSTAAGLLTLHPEGDGTIHGNVVGRDGVRHIVGLPFPDGAVVIIDGSPTADAAALHALVPHVADPPVDDGSAAARSIPAVVVDGRLTVTTALFHVRRTGTRAWQLGEGSPLGLDAEGLPSLRASTRWPLEIVPESWMERGQVGAEPTSDRESRG
jgi:hypothetical protein